MEGHPHPGRLPSKPLGMTGTHQEAGRKAGGYPPHSQGNTAGCHLGRKRKFFNSLVDLSESKIKYQAERLSKQLLCQARCFTKFRLGHLPPSSFPTPASSSLPNPTPPPTPPPPARASPPRAHLPLPQRPDLDANPPPPPPSTGSISSIHCGRPRWHRMTKPRLFSVLQATHGTHSGGSLSEARSTRRSLRIPSLFLPLPSSQKVGTKKCLCKKCRLFISKINAL